MRVKQKPDSALSALPYQLIDTPSKLEGMIAKLAGAPELAVDLEADSLFHYREKVCLLQLAANGHGYLLDPLAVKDLSHLKPLFTNPAQTKIFHGADYDIRSLYRDFRLAIAPLFDTELACRFLGYHPTGLATVLNDRFGVTLNKRFQRSNWAARPLPEEMLVYAIADVTHLAALAGALKDELNAKNRLHWVEEECVYLAQVRAQTRHGEPLFWRFKGAGTLDRRSLAILEAILQTRDRMAQKRDQPVFKIFDNHAVMTLVQTRPTTLKALARSGALSPRQTALWGKRIVRSVNRGLAVKKSEWPHYPATRHDKPPAHLTRRIRRLKSWRKQRAGELELEPGLIINNALLTAIATDLPVQTTDLEAISGLRHWQIAAFGDEIIVLLRQLS